MAKSMSERINCMKCAFFYVTWDANFPRGCHAYEIKSMQMPSAVVLSASGIPCQNMMLKSKAES